MSQTLPFSQPMPQPQSLPDSSLPPLASDTLPPDPPAQTTSLQPVSCMDDADLPEPDDALEYAAWLSAVRRAEQNPTLAEWSARTPANTVLMRAEPAALLELFDAMRAEWRDEEERQQRRAARQEKEPGPLDYITSWLREGWDTSMDNYRSFLASQARYWGHGKFLDSEGNWQKYSSDLLNGFADSTEADLEAAARSRPAPLEPKTSFGRYARDFIQQIPQVGQQIGTTVVNLPAGAAMAWANSAGGQYRELRQQGVDPDRAFAASMGDAALQAPLELFALGKWGAALKAKGWKKRLARGVEGAGSEAVTEYLQSYPEAATNIWATLKEDEGARAWFEHFVAALPKTHDEGLYAAALAAPFGLLGGLGRASHDAGQARRATEFHDRQLALHDHVEAVDMKGFAPRQLEEVLHAGGMDGNISLPASDLLTLHESGSGILAFLGVKLRTVRKAAARGQDLELPLARAHAYLDPEEFRAVARIMREDPDQPNMREAQDLENRLAEDAAETAAVYADYAERQRAIKTELTRIREETAAALPDGVVRNGENAPDIYARLLLAWAQRREARSGVPVAESLRRFRVRAGGDWTRGRPENGAEGFFQPLNEGVDLEREIPITSIERSAPHRSLKEIRSYIQSNVAGKILERFKSGVINKDTGFVITMSKSDLGEHLKSDAASVNIRDQFEAVCALPELMERALLVESHPDSHRRPGVKCVHRFYAPLKIADAMYTVKLTVNEFIDGHLSVDFPSSLKLYHHRLEKKMPSVDMPGFPLNGVTTGQTEGTFNVSLRQLLEDVKDSEGNVFFVADESLRQQDSGRLRQNGEEFFQASISDLADSSIEWKNKFSNVPAKPVSIPLRESSIKEAYEQAREKYSKQYFELADGSMVRVSTEGLKETGSKRAPKENTAILGALPEVLKNTYVFRTEKSTDKKGQTMHGIAAVVIDGEPMLVRSTFKQVLEKGTPFWKYYGSRIMKTARKEGTPVTQVLQESADSKPILHVPSLGNTLYDWIQAVNDSGKRFPEDRTLLYQGEDFAVPRGSITPVDEGYLIRLYDKADLSTMLHETGHFFLLEMEQDIRAGIADASTIKDLAAIRRWLGAQGDAPLTRAQHEAFARGFERYLREGKAPSRELESIFARFRQWLVHLYRKATSLDVELNDDVRAVFNRMLAAEDGFAAAPLPRQRSAASASGTVSAPAPHSAPRLREGLTRKPDSATARVVSLPEHAVPEFAGMKEFAAWLKDMLAEGGDIEIASTGQTARFTRTNVGASVKRSRSSEHRNAYAGLREMVRNAEYDHYEPADERHPNGGGQDVYYSALRMGDRLYSVKLKLDVVTESVRKAREGHGETEIEDIHYKDHKLSEIEIAPALYRDAAVKPFTQPANAISEVSLGILRGSVKPSGIDGQTLFQPAAPGPTPAGSPTRVERLKEMERPDRQRMPARQAVFRTEEKNAVGVPLSRVTRIEGIVTREELDAALSALAGQDLPNLIEGVTAQVNSNQKRKMESTKAGKKSQANGFSFEEHNSVAAQIANAWKWAAEARRTGDEKHNMPDVGIRRYVSALELNGRDAFAWLTVKETPTGLRIYSVELMDEKKLRSTLDSGIAEATTSAPIRSFEETISRLNILVNE